MPFDSALPSSRFAEMVNAHKSRQLEYDPTQLSVTELKFVVDHRLPKSELDWARESVKLRRASFDKIFSSIKYDRPRLEGGIFRWPYGDYRLVQLKKKGNLCGSGLL